MYSPPFLLLCSEVIIGVRQNRAREYPEDNCGKDAGRFGDYRQAVDIGTDEAVYPEAVPQNRKRADTVGLHEALAHELPAPGEACAETEPPGHLKVEKRGISRYPSHRLESGHHAP